MSVAWRRLSLSGFGRFESEVEVEFDDGINVLVAPNESGKSTLAAGLSAVLFGLPGTSNPDEFSQARYRNWNDPLRFEGTLEFAAGGHVYRIRRRFDTHTVTVSRKTDDGWRDVLQGGHNPRARRGHARYESFLQSTLGIVDRRLFEATFAFTQPLPGAQQLDEHVQAMITGAGTSQFADALASLLAEARRLTKFTKDIGLSVRDAVKDGELQALDARIAALREAIETSRATVDASQSLQRDIGRLQAEMQAVRRELEDVEGRIDVWTLWQKLSDEHRAALQRQSQLERAWDAYKSLEAELRSRRRALRDEFPEAAEAPADTGERLDELLALKSERAAGRRQLEAELTALQQRCRELVREWEQYVAERARWSEHEARLREQFAVFEEADDEARALLAAYGATKEALALQAERARAELHRRREAQAALARERARFDEAYGDLDPLNDDAVAAVDERIALLNERAELSSALDARRQAHEKAKRRHVGLRLAAAAAAWFVAAAAYFMEAPVWLPAASALIGVIAAVSAAGAAKRGVSAPELDSLAERLRSVDEALAEQTRLGPFSGLDVPDLRALRERLVARQQAAAALAERAALARPVDGALERELATAEAGLERFTAATAAARARFGEDVERAYRAWEELRHQSQRERAAVMTFSRRHFGRETVAPEDIPVEDLHGDGLPAVWRSAARLLADAGVVTPDAPLTVGELVQGMGSLDDGHVRSAAAVRADREPGLAALKQRIDALVQGLEPILQATAGDVDAAKRRWTEYRRRAAAADLVEKELAGVLAGHGCGSAEELHTRTLQAANTALDAQRRVEELAAAHDWLSRLDDEAARAGGSAPPPALVQRRDELLRRRAAGEERMLQLREKLADLSGRHVVNVAAAEQELRELEQERERLEREVAVVALAYKELRHAADAFRQTHRERLAGRASEYFRAFTGRARRVVLDEQFRVEVQDPDGPLHGVSRLSQGAQDQLYLSLRLAIADLVADDVALPLLLDDPFVHCDDRRLAHIRDALRNLGEGRQVVLFSHRDVFADWGTPVIVRTRSAAGREGPEGNNR